MLYFLICIKQTLIELSIKLCYLTLINLFNSFLFFLKYLCIIICQSSKNQTTQLTIRRKVDILDGWYDIHKKYVFIPLKLVRKCKLIIYIYHNDNKN